jgi:hypothetical protein
MAKTLVKEEKDVASKGGSLLFIEAEFEIEGMAPLLIDGEMVISDEPTPKTPKEWEEFAKKKVFLNSEGQDCIKAIQIKGAIKAAVDTPRLLAQKKDSKSTRQSVRAGIFVQPFLLPIFDLKDKPKHYDEIRCDIVARKGPGGQTLRVNTYRPMYIDWKVQGKIYIDSEWLSVDLVKKLLEAAGRRYGIGGFRPDFGRFKVNYLKEISK